MRRNEHFDELEQSYLFSTIAHKVQAYSEAHPQADLIRMGIGDVTQPICPAVIAALHEAVDEMADKRTFKGYGPEQGYPFLREAIQAYYANFGVALEANEIFVSDGAKSDLGNALDLFDIDNRVWVPDPVYPVYVDTNVMAGRPISYIQATRGKRLSAAAGSQRTGGSDLPVLAQQPNRCGVQPHTAQGMGGLRQRSARHPVVRCGV